MSSCLQYFLYLEDKVRAAGKDKRLSLVFEAPATDEFLLGPDAGLCDSPSTSRRSESTVLRTKLTDCSLNKYRSTPEYEYRHDHGRSRFLHRHANI